MATGIGLPMPVFVAIAPEISKRKESNTLIMLEEHLSSFSIFYRSFIDDPKTLARQGFSGRQGLVQLRSNDRWNVADRAGGMSRPTCKGQVLCRSLGGPSYAGVKPLFIASIFKVCSSRFFLLALD